MSRTGRDDKNLANLDPSDNQGVRSRVENIRVGKAWEENCDQDANVPKEVRRRILEASVRAPQDWHRDAVRAAYGSADEVSRLTAVFCMRFVRGFDE